MTGWTTAVRLQLLGGLVLGLILATGCSRSSKSPPQKEPPKVDVALPMEETVTDYEECVGRTRAMQSIDLRSRVTGYLDTASLDRQGKPRFKEGDFVKKGEILFEIDARTYKAELQRAEATVVQADAHLARLTADMQRGRVLLSRRAISQEEYDKQVGDRAEAEASVRMAKANVDTARTNLEYTVIRAPVSGRISMQNIDPGNLVKADDTILTTLVVLDPIQVYFDLDERTLIKLRRLRYASKTPSIYEGRKLTVDMGLADEPDFPRHGVVTFADNQLDATTGTLRLRAEFPNEDHFLSPGMFVRLRVPIGQPHPALLVSEKALGSDQGQKFLYVINDKNEVEQRNVEVGGLHKGMRVIEKGLKPDEKVVISGLQQVRPRRPAREGLEERPGTIVNPRLVAMPAHSEGQGKEARPLPADEATPTPAGGKGVDRGPAKSATPGTKGR